MEVDVERLATASFAGGEVPQPCRRCLDGVALLPRQTLLALSLIWRLSNFTPQRPLSSLRPAPLAALRRPQPIQLLVGVSEEPPLSLRESQEVDAPAAGSRRVLRLDTRYNIGAGLRLALKQVLVRAGSRWLQRQSSPRQRQVLLDMLQALKRRHRMQVLVATSSAKFGSSLCLWLIYFFVNRSLTSLDNLDLIHHFPARVCSSEFHSRRQAILLGVRMLLSPQRSPRTRACPPVRFVAAVLEIGKVFRRCRIPPWVGVQILQSLGQVLIIKRSLVFYLSEVLFDQVPWRAALVHVSWPVRKIPEAITPVVATHGLPFLDL